MVAIGRGKKVYFALIDNNAWRNKIIGDDRLIDFILRNVLKCSQNGELDPLRYACAHHNSFNKHNCVGRYGTKGTTHKKGKNFCKELEKKNSCRFLPSKWPIKLARGWTVRDKIKIDKLYLLLLFFSLSVDMISIIPVIVLLCCLLAIVQFKCAMWI